MNLSHRIASMIRENGPMAMDEFMYHSMCHPEYGYYNNQEPFGVQGDFTTAPEISQIFGELIAAWVVDIYYKMTASNKITELNIVEIGPGRATLMDDFLRSSKFFPDFHDAISVYLVETSKRLKLIQQEKLQHKHTRISWLETIKDLPSRPTIFIANELFDVLPCRQFIKKSNILLERKIALKTSGELEIILDQSPVNLENFIPSYLLDLYQIESIPEGGIQEVSIASIEFAESLCKIIKNNGGAMLLIDYGYIKNTYRDTIMAIGRHKHHDLLADIGQVDISSHVDFTMLSSVILENNLKLYGPIEQGEFLNNLGVNLRLEKLCQNKTDKIQIDMNKAVARLVEKKQMGSLFKVIAATSGFQAEGFFKSHNS